MAKGLPSAIIKKYGVTKKAWAVFRGTKRKGGKNPTSLAKRGSYRSRAIYRGAYRRSRGFSIPSIASLTMLAPHVLSNCGVAGLGYDTISELQKGDFFNAMRVFMINELMLFTGYDAVAGQFNWKPLMLNYGTILFKKLASKYLRGVKVGPIKIA